VENDGFTAAQEDAQYMQRLGRGLRCRVASTMPLGPATKTLGLWCALGTQAAFAGNADMTETRLRRCILGCASRSWHCTSCLMERVFSSSDAPVRNPVCEHSVKVHTMPYQKSCSITGYRKSILTVKVKLQDVGLIGTDCWHLHLKRFPVRGYLTEAANRSVQLLALGGEANDPD